MNSLQNALTDYRLALFADGATMGNLGTVVELYGLLIDRHREGPELAAVAAPWREGRHDDSSHVLQATVHEAVGIGEAQPIFQLFRSFSGQLTDGVAEGYDAAEEDFHDWLFRLAPLAHASVVLADQMLRERWIPTTARDGVRGRLHTVEEFRVRILDGVIEHLDNLRFRGLAWDRRVDQLRDIARREGHRAMLRRANKMCGQLMLPRPVPRSTRRRRGQQLAIDS